MDKVIIKSKYNEKLHKRFYKFHMFRKSASIYFFLLSAVLSVYLAVANTINPEATPTTIAISWGFSVILLAALPAFTLGKIRGIVKHSMKDRGSTLEILEFTKFKITRFIEGFEGKLILGWEDFESVYELEDCFYFYIDREQGIVVLKDDIVEGNVDILRKLITNNLKPNPKGKIKFKKMYKEKAND